MSVTAKFYKITDDARVLNKTLGTASDKTCKIKGTDSILTPTLVLKYDATIAACNYVYIPAPYNRYYFMSPPVLSPGGRMTIPCTVDPLMSNKSNIESLDVVVTRMERTQYNGAESDFIDDNRAQALTIPNVHTVEADSTPFNTQISSTATTGYTYILSVVGGVKND